ncbi:ATP-binding protein [Alicyclobacillus ferrooxydans]|uniref:ATP-binding protein n=1 Tax=Alicyclobacillus ferrooxydans TaxID=471514 RepID=UPI0012ED1448|nr:ATP-binding protein [Alicyclobacillus ferrooxydans]
MENQVIVRIALLALPLAVYEIIFSRIPSVHKAWNHALVSVLAGLVSLFYAVLPVEISGVSVDFRGIPIVLCTLYGGWADGLLSLAVFLLGQILLGSVLGGNENLTLSMLIYTGLAILMSGWFRRQQPRRRMLAAILFSVVLVTIRLLIAPYHSIARPVTVGYTGFYNGWADLENIGVHAMWLFLCVVAVESVLKEARKRRKLERLNSIFAQAQEIGKMGSWEWILQSGRFIPSKQLKQLFWPISFDDLTLEKFLYTYVHEDDRAALRLWAENLRKGPSPNGLNYRVCLPDGSERVMHVRGLALPYQSGSALRYVGTTQDVTEIRNMERRMNEGIQRAKSIVERNAMGICEFDLDGVFLDVNPAFELLSGYRKEELIGTPGLVIRDEGQALVVHKALEAARLGHILPSMEVVLVDKHGAKIPVTTTNVPIVVDGRPVGFYVMVRDLREEIAAEELVRQSEKLAVAGQLAASVAHEIRNPLTAIKGFMQLMPKVDVTTLIRYKEIIDAELANIERISSELLMLAKPQADAWGVYDLNRILESTVVLMEPQALMQSVVLTLESEPIEGLVYCIEGQLKQVCTNMVKNALEATPDGGSISLRLERKATEYAIYIRDTGKGIPKDVIPRLGEPFYTTKDKGTGLGLMVCHRIVDRHHGRIQYDSSPEGTLVSIFLPKLDSAACDPSAAPEQNGSLAEGMESQGISVGRVALYH